MSNSAFQAISSLIIDSTQLQNTGTPQDPNLSFATNPQVRGNIIIESGNMLEFHNPADTFLTSIKAGTQTSNINLTLPIAPPTNNSFLSCNLSGVASWVNIVSSALVQTYYVSSSIGSNSTGDGSLYRPYATISHAMAVISGQTNTSPANIVLLDNAYNETSQILWKPNVNLSSSNPECFVDGSFSIILDSTSWAALGAVTANIGAMNIRFNIGLDLNFSIAGATSTQTANFENCIFNSTFKANGLPLKTSFTLNFNTHNDTVTVNNINFIYSISNTYSDMIINDTGYSAFTGSTELNSNVDTFNGNFTLISPLAAHPVSALFYTTQFNGINTASYSTSSIGYDVVSWYATTLLNSAPTPVLITLSDGLSTNFIPSHFTPVDSSVKGALQGIDTKLGTLGSGTVTSISSGSNIVLTPNPITTTGTVALSATPSGLTTLGVGNLTISGGQISCSSSSNLTLTSNGGNSITLTPNGAGVVQIFNGSTAVPINFYNSGASHFTGLKAGAVTSNVTFTLPIADTAGVMASDGSTNLFLTASPSIFRSIVSVSGTTKTFALADANTFQQCSNAATQTLTVPTNASVAFTIGTEIDIYQEGVGQVVIAAAGGVTIESAFSNLKVAAQYTGVSLKKLATDTWALVGNLTA